MVALISDTLKYESLRMKKYFEELVIHVRTNIVGADGEVDIKLMLRAGVNPNTKSASGEKRAPYKFRKKDSPRPSLAGYNQSNLKGGVER